MNIPPIDQIISTALPYVIGALGGIGTVFLSGFSKEFFDERARTKRHRINVANKVHSICVEAYSSNYEEPPRDVEGVNSIISSLAGIDKDTSLILEYFVGLWGVAIADSSGEKPDKMSKKEFKALYQHLNENREVLVEWANKIRAGK